MKKMGIDDNIPVVMRERKQRYELAGIDRQLYAKYGLSADEVAFIEKIIKPME